jgi:hypothetical protein
MLAAILATGGWLLLIGSNGTSAGAAVHWLHLALAVPVVLPVALHAWRFSALRLILTGGAFAGTLIAFATPALEAPLARAIESRSLLLEAGGKTLLAANFDGGSVSRIDRATGRRLAEAVLGGDLTSVAVDPDDHLIAATLVDQDPLPADQRRGERLFELANSAVFPEAPMTGDNWMSCASCHVDGFNFTNRALFRDTPVDKFRSAVTGHGSIAKLVAGDFIGDYIRMIQNTQGGMGADTRFPTPRTDPAHRPRPPDARGRGMIRDLHAYVVSPGNLPLLATWLRGAGAGASVAAGTGPARRPARVATATSSGNGPTRCTISWASPIPTTSCWRTSPRRPRASRSAPGAWAVMRRRRRSPARPKPTRPRICSTATAPRSWPACRRRRTASTRARLPVLPPRYQSRGLGRHLSRPLSLAGGLAGLGAAIFLDL